MEGQTGAVAEAHTTLLLLKKLGELQVASRPEIAPNTDASRTVANAGPLAVYTRSQRAPLLRIREATTGKDDQGRMKRPSFMDILDVAEGKTASSPTPTIAIPASPRPTSPHKPTSPASAGSPASPSPAGDSLQQDGDGQADIVLVLPSALGDARVSALSSALATLLPSGEAYARLASCMRHSEPAYAPPDGAPTTPTDQPTSAGQVDKLASPLRDGAAGAVNTTCFLFCEVTADARLLLHKLVQLEVNARALAANARGWVSVESAFSMAPDVVGEVVTLVGVAAPLGNLNTQVLGRVLKFVEDNLPFVHYMLKQQRLVWVHLADEMRNSHMATASLLTRMEVVERKLEVVERKLDALSAAISKMDAKLDKLSRPLCCVM